MGIYMRVLVLGLFISSSITALASEWKEKEWQWGIELKVSEETLEMADKPVE